MRCLPFLRPPLGKKGWPVSSRVVWGQMFANIKDMLYCQPARGAADKILSFFGFHTKSGSCHLPVQRLKTILTAIKNTSSTIKYDFRLRLTNIRTMFNVNFAIINGWVFFFSLTLRGCCRNSCTYKTRKRWTIARFKLREHWALKTVPNEYIFLKSMIEK